MSWNWRNRKNPPGRRAKWPGCLCDPDWRLPVPAHTGQSRRRAIALQISHDSHAADQAHGEVLCRVSYRCLLSLVHHSNDADVLRSNAVNQRVRIFRQDKLACSGSLPRMPHNGEVAQAISGTAYCINHRLRRCRIVRRNVVADGFDIPLRAGRPFKRFFSWHS